MELRPAEVTSVLKRELEGYQDTLEMESVGIVLQAGDGVARIHGLEGCMMSELLEFSGGAMGVALSLEEDNVGAVLLGGAETVKEGDEVKSTGRVISVPTGPALIGRVVNALGQPVDGRGDLGVSEDDYQPIESDAPSVVERQPVHEPLETGIKAIDSMIPIGRGQRELIIGDRQTGKTALLLDTIINQKGKDVVCIYVAMGQKQSTVKAAVAKLEQHGAMEYTTVVSAPAGDEAAMQYLAAFAGCAMGERFRDEGKHVVIMYDDLYKQALAYRQVMLLLRRPPGREAFPGDIFNLHSRLLERAAKVGDEAPKINKRYKAGGGSLTALPVVETQEGDVSAYIPTNVISITDGQIFLEGDLFYAGVRPAVNVGISVSRVGGAAQVPAMKKVAGGLRINLAQYRELQAFAQFGSDLDKATQEQLNRGERLVEILKQGQYAPVPTEEQILVIHAGTSGSLDEVPSKDAIRWEAEFVEYLRASQADLLEKIASEGQWTDEIKDEADAAIAAFNERFGAAAPAATGVEKTESTEGEES